MRVTDIDVIKNGERELIDAIIADLNWGVIEEVFRKEHGLTIKEDVEYKKGDLVVYEDQIVYKLEFEVKVGLHVLVDREGNCLTVKSPTAPCEGKEPDPGSVSRACEMEDLREPELSAEGGGPKPPLVPHEVPIPGQGRNAEETILLKASEAMEIMAGMGGQAHGQG